MVRAFLPGGVTAVSVLAPGDVGFHADDGLDARGLHLIVKGNRAVQIAVIGYRYGTGAEFLGTLSEGLYLDRSVKETEVGVKMKVDKIFFVHCFFRCGSGACCSWSRRTGPNSISCPNAIVRARDENMFYGFAV